MQSNLNHGADVALFIDWENFKISLAVGNRTPNVSALKEEVSNHGRVVIAKAYADWVTRAPELRGASQFLNDPPSLYAAGIEPVFVPTRAPSPNATNANGMRTGRIKNSVDVKMTADCIEIAHSYPNIGTFVLVSGDSDFIHVVNALRTMGKHVIVVGISWSTSRRLADQVDTLILYDVDVDPPETIAEPVEPSVQPAEPALDRTSAADLNDVIRAIEEIIRDERKAGGNPLLTSIKQRLVRRYPDFDEKKLGYTGFKRLMARAAQNGNVRLITAGLVDWAIMADEDIPEGATEATFSGFNARPGRRRGRLPRSRQEDQAPEPEPVSAELDESSMVEDTGTDHEPDHQMVEDTGTDHEPDHQMVEDTGTDHEPDHQMVPAVTTNGQQDLEYESEASSDSPEGDSYTPSSPFADNQELAQTLQEAISSLGMPTEPDDGQQADRVSDLIFMANTLEHQEGISHVAFNFLVSEICDALGQGIEAGHADITQRWGQASSRTYVSKMLRSLSDGEFFLKGNHSWRDENSGQNRRRRTFNLNHDHSLVQQALAARSEDAAPPTSESDSSSSEPEKQQEPQESQETGDSVEQVVAAAIAELPGEPVYEDDDEDYESGKNAAEARAETGFMSRLFNTRRRI